MKRTRRLLGAALTLLVVVLLGDFLIETIAFERMRRLVEARLSETLGLEVRIQGDFQLDLLPRPRFAASRTWTKTSSKRRAGSAGKTSGVRWHPAG